MKTRTDRSRGNGARPIRLVYCPTCQTNSTNLYTALRRGGFLRHGWVYEAGRGDQKTTRNTVVAPTSCVEPVAGLRCSPLGTSRLAGTTARGYSGHGLFPSLLRRLPSAESLTAAFPTTRILPTVLASPLPKETWQTSNERASPRATTVLRRPQRSSGILQPIAIQVAALK